MVLAKRISACARRGPASPCRGRIHRLGPHGLDRIDDREAGGGRRGSRGCLAWSRRRDPPATARPSRSARNRTWATASSPEIYVMRGPCGRGRRRLAKGASICRCRDRRRAGHRSGTKPPPITRSSSPMPEAVRGASWVSPERRSSGKMRPFRVRARATGPKWTAAPFPRQWCSTRRRPRTCPSSDCRRHRRIWQAKEGCCFAIRFFRPR